MDNITLTIEQIKLMKHAIGFELSRIKRRKYIAFRNYFCAGKEMSEFEDLITKELAVKDIRQDKVYYFITEKGIDILSEVTGVIIKEMD